MLATMSAITPSERYCDPATNYELCSARDTRPKGGIWYFRGF